MDYTFPQQYLKEAEKGFDKHINQFGKLSRLVYDTVSPSPCPNCILDVSSNSSTGVYKVGGPSPFTDGQCPVCYGAGYLQEASPHKDVRLLLNWKPKLDIILEGNLKVPNNVVAVKGFLSDMPDLIQAKYIILDYQNAGFDSNRFVCMSRPTPQGNMVPKYFRCICKREGI